MIIWTLIGNDWFNEDGDTISDYVDYCEAFKDFKGRPCIRCRGLSHVIVDIYRETKSTVFVTVFDGKRKFNKPRIVIEQPTVLPEKASQGWAFDVDGSEVVYVPEDQVRGFRKYKTLRGAQCFAEEMEQEMAYDPEDEGLNETR